MITSWSSRTYRAATRRVFDPVARLWSIWWVDGGTPRLEPLVHGRFEDGVGTFRGDDVLDDGRTVRVRFTWSEITGLAWWWDQAFSADGDATWEDNWIMRFERGVCKTLLDADGRALRSSWALAVP